MADPAALTTQFAELSDLNALISLAESRGSDRQSLIDRFRHLDENPDHTWVLLRAGDRFIGWAILQSHIAPHYNYPELEDLYIHPEFRNRGYGTFLIGEIEKLARERGMKGLSLGVNPDDNSDARRLYERLGYRHDGGEKRLDGVYGEYEDWTIGLEKEL